MGINQPQQLWQPPRPGERQEQGQEQPERQIDDVDLMDIAHDEVQARVLRKALQKLADDASGNGVLQEMAREVLSGRIGLRDAVRVSTYSEALGEGVERGVRAMEQQTAEEREQSQAEAERYLQAQREEIDEERRTAAQTRTTAPRHARPSGHDWRL